MLVYGKNICKELITNGKRINKVYLKEGFRDIDIIFI